MSKKLYMAYHENGGNESFKIRGGGNADTQGNLRHHAITQLHRSYGLSFDANYGFITIRESAHTLKIGSCPQWKSGVLIVK